MENTRSLLWSHSECLEDLWDSFVAIKVLWTRGPAVSGTLSWLKSFYFVILDVSSRNPVKQQYFSVPGLGEYRYIARKSGRKERERVFSGFFYSPLSQMSRGYEDHHSLMYRGGAAVFPTLRQGSFRGTTPVEFDKYSKAFISRSSSLDSSSLWNSSKL
ncbi:hypothetical protein HID58_042863 [Brassica napus]|uniref:Uncharacterized protein n=1 Tax=Brassica napus TaxID=3708 RepID=A0ABQ8BEY2_BRANA|nr:hypothetical protein HID58_042863 [Brassica napus]